MKIAIIGSSGQKNNKNSFGGVEIFNYLLKQGLRKRGHQIKLFTNILDNFIDQEKWQKISTTRQIHLGVFAHYLDFFDFLENEQKFDFLIVSVYNFYFLCPLLKLLKIPFLIIIHGPCLDKELTKLLIYKKYKNLNLINVSKYMAKNFSKNYPNKVIYNAVDVNSFQFNKNGGSKFLWLGRIVKNKGLKEAIEIAKKTKINLDIFGPIRDKEYFNYGIKPLLDKKIKYRGIADHKIKNKFYGQSRAFLAPIQWNEPFGLVFIESMACGTPVITFQKGAVPEVIIDGKTGFICSSGDEKAMIKAVKKIASMPEKEYLQIRKNCREHVKKHFSLERMVDDYEKVIKEIIKDFKIKN